MPRKIHTTVRDAKSVSEIRQFVDTEVKRIIKEEKLDATAEAEVRARIVNTPDENHRYPLEYARASDSRTTINILHYLITEAKADVSNTPRLIEHAAQQTDIAARYVVGNAFYQKGHITGVQRDAYVGYVENVVDVLSKQPEEILKQDQWGRSLFYWLAISYQKEIVDVFLSHDAFTSHRSEHSKLYGDLASGYEKNINITRLSVPFYTRLNVPKLSDDDQ